MEKRGFYLYKLVALILLVLGILFPLLVSDQYVIRIINMTFIYIILSMSLNLITGVTGQFHLGHAAFYGVGAYIAALLSVKLHVSFLLAFIAGGIGAGFIGLLIGLPTIRLRDIYLTVTTLGFGEIVRLILLNWVSVTRGPMGIPGIPYPEFFGIKIMSQIDFYYLIFFVLILSVVVLFRITYSRYGDILRAVRENELAAKTLGINTTIYKVTAFVIGALFAGLAGALFAYFSAYISPDSFTFAESINILAMVVIGGLGSMPGAILGAVILALAPEAFRFLAEYRMVVVGLLMLGVILWRHSGLIGEQTAIKFMNMKIGGK